MRQTDAIKLVKKFECLGFPPRTPEGITALADAMVAIAGSEENILWLSQQIIMGCPRCPTPLEMRRIMERKAPPADGLSSAHVDASKLMSGGRDDE